MAGRNHHFIAQMLQRGFAAGETGAGAQQVWVFRRGKRPFLTNTKNSFVEKDFYGSLEDTSLDDAITDEEHNLNRFLTDARRSITRRNIGRSAEATSAVWHIGLRARWMRDLLQAFSEAAIDRMRKALKDPERKTGMLRKVFKEKDWLLNALISEASKRSGRLLTRVEADAVRELTQRIEAQPELLSANIDAEAFIEFAEDFHKKLGNVAVRAHQELLRNNLFKGGSGLREHLGKMTWEIVVPNQAPLILGDCGPLTLDDQGVPLGPMGTFELPYWRAIALPISSSRLLLGTQNLSLDVVSSHALNVGAAQWCRETFISEANSSANQELQTRINTLVNRFIQSQLDVEF